jgi:hypothetical protein
MRPRTQGRHRSYGTFGATVHHVACFILAFCLKSKHPPAENASS